MRVVLDTNILVSGFLWRSFPRQLLDLARADAITIYTSGPLLDELADVLSRNKLAAKLLEQQVTPAYLMQRYGMLRLSRPQSSPEWCRTMWMMMR